MPTQATIRRSPCSLFGFLELASPSNELGINLVRVYLVQLLVPGAKEDSSSPSAPESPPNDKSEAFPPSLRVLAPHSTTHFDTFNHENTSGARYCPETFLKRHDRIWSAKRIKSCRTFTPKGVSWDGIYDIIAISIATAANIFNSYCRLGLPCRS